MKKPIFIILFNFNCNNMSINTILQYYLTIFHTCFLPHIVKILDSAQWDNIEFSAMSHCYNVVAIL